MNTPLRSVDFKSNLILQQSALSKPSVCIFCFVNRLALNRYFGNSYTQSYWTWYTGMYSSFTPFNFAGIWVGTVDFFPTDFFLVKTAK